MKYWVYSKIHLTGPKDEYLEMEVMPDRGHFPEYGYFVQPPQKEDWNNMEDRELIRKIFEVAAPRIQGKRIEFRVGKE